MSTPAIGPSGLILRYRVQPAWAPRDIAELLTALRSADLAVDEAENHVMVSIQSGDLRRLAAFYEVLTKFYDLSKPAQYATHVPTATIFCGPANRP